VNAAVELRDHAVCMATPLVPMPRFGALEALEAGQKRLLAGANGLYLEVKSPALHACVQLSEVPTPYGEVAPFLRLTGGRVPRARLLEFVHAACASPDTEIARGLEWRADAGYGWVTPRVQSQSGGHITYVDGFDDCRLVVDAHSHARYDAFFSGADDESDLGRPGPYIALVVGNCTDPCEATVLARFVCAPYLIPIDLDATWIA
jgi:PRTRC genetic system protein A